MITLRPIIVLLLAALLTACNDPASANPAPDPAAKLSDSFSLREGDVVFQSFPDAPLTRMIEGATQSPYSHCGIVGRVNNQLCVLEAVGPVKATPLREWIARGREHRIDVYRLAPKYDAKIPAILAAAQAFKGRPYDSRFRMDDEAIYCSELVYKAFKTATGEELGKLVKVRELDWQPHEALIRKLEGGDPPLDREMITPRDLAKAEQLTQVFASGEEAK